MVFVFIIDFVSTIKSAIVLSLRFVIGVFMRYPINRTVPIVIHPKKLKIPNQNFVEMEYYCLVLIEQQTHR
ncbi:MAG: hypothetical protein CM1200mP10_05340 [Candidatus Neomarinimicrobiota bacterium]|nr:MAG: hypothetical protein CM1200mP10_05340 [Candidatus Neomarinimicrobiota bacterium]